METPTSAGNVQVDNLDKKQSANILKDLNMSTFINIEIKHEGLPFEVSNLKPSKELLDALEEGQNIITEIKSGKRAGYKNVNEMMRSILDD
ncbi:MAG: hypothetical protein IJ134_00860 [Bacilli bacterium]|nr:hypothetical protein [Bacilli bacterium]